MNEEIQRINIKLSKNTHEWLKKRSKMTGASMSALAALAIDEQMRQLTLIPLLPEMMEQLKKLEGTVQRNA